MLKANNDNNNIRKSNMYIFLCEDIEEHSEHFLKSMNEISDEMNLDMKLEVFETAELLLDTLADRITAGVKLPDVIFADVELPGMNGIDMGKKVHQMAPNICLILLTAFAEYAILGYETRAYRYLLKPANKEDLYQIFSNIAQRKNKEKSLVIKVSDEEKVISIADILYMSAEDKYTVIHTSEGDFLDRKSLQYYERCFGDIGYFRIHRKYLVNLRHHKAIVNGKVILDNNEKLPLSRRKDLDYHAYMLNLLERGILK